MNQKFKILNYFDNNINDHLQVIESISSLGAEIEHAVLKIIDVLKSGNKIIFCGNGGSAADCQHMAAEFIGRFTSNRKPLAALSISTDTSVLTCVGNDYSFDAVFARQVQALGSPGDCLIGISTSGNSMNVIEAVNAAKNMGIYTIGILGFDGGKLASVCDHSLVVHSMVTARIQEAHLLIEHTICGAVEQTLGLVGDLRA